MDPIKYRKDQKRELKKKIAYEEELGANIRWMEFYENEKCINILEPCETEGGYLSLDSKIKLENVQTAELTFDPQTNIQLDKVRNVNLVQLDHYFEDLNILIDNDEVEKFPTDINIYESNGPVVFNDTPSDSYKRHDKPVSYFLTSFHIRSSQNVSFYEDISYSKLVLHNSSVDFHSKITNTYFLVYSGKKDSEYDFKEADLDNVFFEVKNIENCPTLRSKKNIYSIGEVNCEGMKNISKKEAESLFISQLKSTETPLLTHFYRKVAWQLSGSYKAQNDLASFFIKNQVAFDNFYEYLKDYRNSKS